MNASLFDTLKAQFPGMQFSQEELLAPHTYAKVGGPAEVFVKVLERKDLEKLVIFCRKNDIPLTMLGGGSNVLVADEGIRGLVIKNLTTHYEVDQDKGTIDVDSGVPTNVLVRAALNAGLKGLEQFMGVPGTVGGAIFNNSHFATELIGEFVKNVHIINAKGERQTMTKEEMLFAYDYSILHETRDVIISLEFALEKGTTADLEKVAFDATRKRATTQPLGIPSSGCMFKNVTMPDGKKVGAGYLIDQAGLKGKTMGGAKVSEVHANFIVNTGTATQKDIEALAQFVEKTIHEKYGVELKREVFRLGGA